MALVLIAWGLGALFAAAGLAITDSETLAPLAGLLIVAFLFNLLLVWVDRREVPEWVIVWGARLGNLVFLTAGVHLTGGFHSPFFSLYAIYLVIAGLRYGWRGTARSYVLCFLGWLALVVVAPPVELQEWAWTGMLVSAFLVLAMAIGILADRYVRFWQESVQRNREMTFLREASRALGASLDPQEVLAETLARANELLDVEAASLALVDPQTGRITFELAIGGGDKEIEGMRLEPGEGIVGHVIQEDRSLFIPDVAADPRWHAGVDSVSGFQTRSILCVPLRVKGQVIGALEALNKRAGPFTEHDLRLFSSLADLAAQSIENARLYAQIRRSAKRLEAAYNEVQKLDELKSAFIRNVTHELRTPLALIEGYVELLLDGQMGSLQLDQRESLNLVAEKSAQLSHMVNDIISLQTVGAMGFDFKVISLLPLAQSAVDKARRRAEKARIRFELKMPPAKDLPVIQGDARRLSRIIDHLLDNAIKFSPNGGTVTLSLEHEGEMLFFRVKDEGIGLPEDQLELIFDRFYQVDGSATRRFGGTGLGLAQVKEVVEAHGGAVWVESDGPGQGSTFTVFFPIYRT
jgi:signal transduction histidine kinase